MAVLPSFLRVHWWQGPWSWGGSAWHRQFTCPQRVTELPDGQVGEIIICGYNVMKGYWRNPGATAETITGAWLRTGDLARVDEDGYFYIVDRKKDLIIRGGFNVYPREIEEVLYEDPAVAEAAVIGIPD